ncbi:MAG TPA: hypothetical protein PK733_16915, partial [Clostridiales bacterium]|nr:hypothetical protein [Clostridiales bacterium]
YYEIGIQPIYDYLYAIIIIDKIKRNAFEKLPDNLKSNNGTLQMASIILLNDYNTLLSDYSVFERSLKNNDLYDLIFYALANVSPLIAKGYVPLIKSLLTQGAFAVKAITNKVFLSVARIEGHPLSPIILHEFLMEFENAGQRDLFWSVPSILVFSMSKWNNRIELNLQNETYKLTSGDKAIGLPLIYAWSLTSVDNVKRAYYRKELFNWSILQPLEFIELFKITYQANDPQMKEELLSIAMGIVFTMPTDSLVIDTFGKWVLEEVFTDGKIQNTFDAAIRYYSRAIAERAYSCGFISQKQILECRPPYKSSSKCISMNIDATEGTVMSGYGPIDYDLSRYVLCDSIKSQFFNLPFGYDRNDNNYVYYKEADEFLSVHAKQLNIKNLEHHQFVLSASYSYLLNCGWNEEDFYGEPNGGKKGEVLGADIAIIRQYHPATHGSKSNVMSFAEKYVWCAKNEILGYLADRLPFCDAETQHMVEDYGVLEDFIIPAQEIDQQNPEELSDNEKWYLPEKLSPTIDYLQNRTEKDIIQWINEVRIPNFELWININKQGYNVSLDYDIDLLTLFSYNCQSEHNTGVETMMWISSGFIHDAQFKPFLNDLNINNNDIVHIFREPERFTASTESSCYLTPKEICWMTWKKDKNSKVEIYDLNEPDKIKYKIIKAVEDTVCNFDEYGEIYYKLPSKYVRSILEIIDGNGYRYYDQNKKLVGISFEYGEKWHDYQKNLCVDKNTLEQTLSAENMKMFWVIRLLREPSSKSKEKFSKLYYRRDRCWIVWFENGKMNCELFFDGADRLI